MGIKVIDELPWEEKKDMRMEQLKADLREIIEKRIRVCEIVDVQYPEGTMRDRLHNALRKVLWEYAELDKKNFRALPVDTRVLEIKSRKIDGERHWYMTFDVETWDEGWRKFREENR